MRELRPDKRDAVFVENASARRRNGSFAPGEMQTLFEKFFASPACVIENMRRCEDRPSGEQQQNDAAASLENGIAHDLIAEADED